MNKKIRTLFILGCLLLVFSVNNAVQAQTNTTALEIFKAANLAHGGDKLDNLKTLRIKISDSKGEESIVLYDFTNQKYRSEKRNNNKLEIRQVEGNEGWKWVDGGKKPLSEVETRALKTLFCFGDVGLRSECLKRISLGETIIAEENKLKHFPIRIDNDGFNYRIDQNNHLKEILLVSGERARLFIYDDFRTVNGIVFSFLRTAKRVALIEGVLTETEEVISKVSSIEVNPEFTASDWDVPTYSK